MLCACRWINGRVDRVEYVFCIYAARQKIKTKTWRFRQRDYVERPVINKEQCQLTITVEKQGNQKVSVHLMMYCNRQVHRDFLITLYKN